MKHLERISNLLMSGGRKGLALGTTKSTSKEDSTSYPRSFLSSSSFASNHFSPRELDIRQAEETSSSLPPYYTPPPGLTLNKPPVPGVHLDGDVGPSGLITPQTLQFWRQLKFDKDYNRIYWYFLAVVLGFFVLRRVILSLLLLRRGSTSSPSSHYPPDHERGKKSSKTPPLPSFIAAIELFGNKTFRRPTWAWAEWLSAGKMASVVVLVAWNVAFLFPKSLPSHFPETGDGNYMKFIAARCSSTAIQNLPLLYALSGRNNIVSFLVSVPSTGLRFFHKLVGILVFFCALAHAIIMSVATSRYGGYEFYKACLDVPLFRHGVLSMCGVSIMFFFSLPPVRTRLYELFLSTHYVGSGCLLAGIYLHQPRRQAWVYVCIGLWSVDHAIRLFQIFRNHIVLPLLHRGGLPPGSHIGELGRITARVEMIPGAILLSIPYLGYWGPGQHCYISFTDETWSFRWWRWFEGHPWTISSLPIPIPAPVNPRSDPSSPLVHEMRFIIREKTGITKDLHRIVEARGLSPEGNSWPMSIKVIVDGPYGSSTRTEGFERVMLFAGGSGVTHNFSMLLKIIEKCRDRTQGETTKVDFVWAIQGLEHMRWISEHLNNAIRSLPPACPIEFSILIYVTRPNALEARRLSLPPNTFTESNPSSEHGHGPLIGAGSEPGGAWPSTKVNLDPPTTFRSAKSSMEKGDHALAGYSKSQDGTDGSQRQSPADSYPPVPIGRISYTTYGGDALSDGVSPGSNPVKGLATKVEKEKSSNDWQVQVAGICSEVDHITTIKPGRPPALELVEEAVEQAVGGVLVVACGSDGLAIEVETAVARASRPVQALKRGQKGRGFVKAEIARFVA